MERPAMTPSTLNNRPGCEAKVSPIAEINITPMVDVMLVLLVIFMVTAPLLVAGVKIDLAKTSAPKISHLNKPLIVSVNAGGELHVGDNLVPRDALCRRLSELKANGGDKPVFLQADRNLRYGDVLELLASISEAGFHQVSLLSRPAGGENAGEPAAP